jgi:eukaryotic-like serine/threonine-protein kinase
VHPDCLVADRYRLVRQVAVGGMSSVWEAWDERLQRRVALKRLQPQPGLGEGEARLGAERAMREARITARLHHPHAVPVYDVVDHEGAPCLIMQYHPAKSMQRLIEERGALSVADVARIGAEIAAALSAAHEAGIVHRDVKPGNILIAADGSAKLTDFGISRAYGDVTLTATGMVTGTPAYLAPEIARGDKPGFASDVFSLGATLYAALEGTSPVGTADNPMALLHRVASGQLRPPQRSGPLEPLLRRMLALDQRQRPSMEAVAMELSRMHAASAHPTEALPTRRQAQRVPAPPPSTTMTLPPARDGVVPTATPAPSAHRSGHRRAWAATLALVAALLVAGILVLLATSLGQGSAGNNPPKAGGTTTRHAAARVSSPPAPAHSKLAPTPAPKPKTTTASTPSPATPPTAEPSPSEQITAVRDYYNLLPDNTAEAWDRLTASYQAQTGGRGNYQQFWHGFQSVSTTNERFSNGVVLADLTYTREDGSQSSETRSFTLVQGDGILKIADSQVVNG